MDNILKKSTLLRMTKVIITFINFKLKGLVVNAILMKFSIKDFLSKCDQFRRKLRIWSHLLKKSLKFLVQCMTYLHLKSYWKNIIVSIH